MTTSRASAPRSIVALALLVLAGFGAPSAAFASDDGAREYAQVTVVGTTDLHGRIYPVDYLTDFPFEGGLAKISTVVKTLRETDPELILVDSGDTIQGNPLAFYHALRDNGPVDPMMLVMNHLRYDSMTVGNHDFNYGMDVQGKARSEAHFPWLSANTYNVATGQPGYQPYVIKVVRGIRIGILGLTTPAIPHWDPPEHFRGLEFHDPLTEARKWVAVLRNQEHVDAVVIAMHMGLERNLSDGSIPFQGTFPEENRALAIANGVPGIDLILLGHTHVEIPDLSVNGVLLAQAGRWGDHLVEAHLDFSRQGAGPWRVTGKDAHTWSMRGIDPDQDVLEMTKAYHEETERWLSKPIGTCDRNLNMRSLFTDSPLLDLIHRVQLEAGHADVSIASVFNTRARIDAGPVTVRQLAGIYIYDNTLVVVQMTGAQLKAALEHSARFFLPYDPSKTLNELINPHMLAYDFDKAEGVSYEIDVRRTVGDRIRNLTFKGQPVRPDQIFRVAINDHRYGGSGGYGMYPHCPVLYRSSETLRDMLIDWVELHHVIPTEPVNNWRIVTGKPSDTTAPFKGEDKL